MLQSTATDAPVGTAVPLVSTQSTIQETSRVLKCVKVRLWVNVAEYVSQIETCYNDSLSKDYEGNVDLGSNHYYIGTSSCFLFYV